MTWGDTYRRLLRRGYDHGYAAHRADAAERRVGTKSRHDNSKSLWGLLANKEKAPSAEIGSAPSVSTGTGKDIAMFFGNGKKEEGGSLPLLDGNVNNFKKRLKWWIRDHTGTVIIDITPEMARDMLEWNEPCEVDGEIRRNRPMTQSVMAEYADAMRTDAWGANTGDPIKFSRYRLIDGQKRLAAIVASGKIVTFDVRFGCDDDAFYFFDIGEKRRAGQIFHVHGVANAAMMAAVSGMLFHYDRGSIATGLGGLKPSHKLLYEFFLTHKEMPKSAHFGHLFHTNKGLMEPAVGAFLHYIFARKHRALADDFMTKLATGAEIKRAEPVFGIRKRLIENTANVEKLPRKVKVAFAIKAWNATRAGIPMRICKWDEDAESFPKAQ